MKRRIQLSFARPMIALALLLVTGTALKAQGLQFNAAYNINFPTGPSFRNLVDHAAFKGFTAGFAYPVMSRLRVGLSIGYNDYYQKYARQVYSNGPGSDISAVVSNSIQQAPLLVTVDYTFLKKGLLRPYIGAGAGINFITFDQYLGEFDNPVNSTYFAARGEAGLLLPLSKTSGTAVRIGGSFNYAPYKKYGIDDLNNWGVHAGISVPFH